MGTNILFVELVGKKNSFNYAYPAFITNRISWFDTYRHKGDREFRCHVYKNGESICEDTSDYPDPGMIVLWRVLDFDKAREWIKENIVKVNQERLINALEYMEKHTGTYFEFN